MTGEEFKDPRLVIDSKRLIIIQNIESLKKMNLGVNKYLFKLNSIISKIDDNKDKDFDSLNQEELNIYKLVIQELLELEDKIINENDGYIKLKNNSLLLKEKFNESGSISEVQNFAIDLLKDIMTSNIIGNVIYDSPQLLSDLFKLIYQIIEQAFLNDNTTELFEFIKNDETLSVYVVDVIKTKLTSDYISPKLEKKIREIESKGLEGSNYLDRGLILLIASNENNKKIDDQRLEFLSMIKDYQLKEEIIEDEKNEINLSLYKVKNARKAKNKIIVSRLKLKLLVLINLGIIGLSSLTIAKYIKGKTYTNLYNTVETIYDSSLGVTTSKETIDEERKEGTTLTEYSPWESPGYFRDYYERNAYQYDLNKIKNYQDLKQYLNSDLKNNMEVTETREKSKNIPEDYGYAENKYIIKRIEQDRDNIASTEFNKKLFILYSVSISIAVALVESLIFAAVYSSQAGFRQLSRNEKKAREDIKMAKKELLEKKESLNDYLHILDQSKNFIEDKFHTLPYQIKEDDEVRKGLYKDVFKRDDLL